MHVALLSIFAVACAEASLGYFATPVSSGASAAPAVAIAPAASPIVPSTMAVAAAEPVLAVAPTVSAAQQDSQGLVFEGESDQAVVERVLAYIDAMTTLEADFTQVAPSGAVSSGKFYLRRPGLLRFEYAPPRPLLIVANSGMVYVRDEALETTDSYPVGKTPLKFLLRRDVALGDVEVVAVDRGVDSVAITFSSTDDETEGELSVILSAPELALEQWVVRDPRNGLTLVSLDNVTMGGSIPNRLFRVPEAGGTFIRN